MGVSPMVWIGGMGVPPMVWIRGMGVPPMIWIRGMGVPPMVWIGSCIPIAIHGRDARATFHRLATLSVFESPKFLVRPPDAHRQRAQVGIGCNEQVCHRRRSLAGECHLPARHEYKRGRKGFALLRLVTKSKGGEEMRPSERRAHVPHGDRVLRHIPDPALHVGKASRTAGLMHERNLGTGQRRFNRRPLRVKVRLVRVEDRFEHGERIEGVDRE
jgi:hypothetical protein